MGTVLSIAFAALMLLGVPIGVSMGMSSILSIIIANKYSTVAVVHKMINGVDSYVLMAVPFFILAGQLMNTGGITKKIFSFADAMVGHIPGGLGHVNVMASVIFSGMSGSAAADAGGLGQIEMEAMNEKGFDPEFSAAVTAASATVGPIIPPSVPMVVYGAMAEVSVGKLFFGGFIPGLLLSAFTMVLVYIISVKRGYPKNSGFSMEVFLKSFKEAFLSLLTPVIIIGGIWTGIFTPTEAAIVATVYSFILGVIVYKELSLKELAKVLRDTAVSTGAIVFIVGAAASFTWIVAMEGLPKLVTEYLFSITTDPYIIVLLINIALLILGMFINSLGILTITVPFLVPIINSVGLNPIHIGVMVVLNLMIGQITPPVGISLFIVSKIGNVRLERLYVAILPFIIPLMIALIIVSFVPDTVLFLPNLVFGK